MKVAIARKYELTRSDIQTAVWLWLKSMDGPVPESAKELRIVGDEMLGDILEFSWDDVLQFPEATHENR